MSQNWRSTHLVAIAESRRAHRDLNVDISQPIDPFLALQHSGVLVMRQPLDRLSGAYLPGDPTTGDQPGVLINVHHPLSRQRYTAAHELWHHRRDSDIILDSDTEWMARGEYGSSDRERLAEAFASWFLMPQELVQSSIDTLEVDVSALNEQSAYALSLELGTSYSATVRHLHTLRLISAASRDQLLRVTPQSIKQTLVEIDMITDPRSDIRSIGPKKWKQSVNLTEGDLLLLYMNETPSSGYIWRPTTFSDTTVLTYDEYRASSGEVLGGSGLHRFVFAIRGSGEHRIRVELSRPWLPERTADAQEIDVVVVPKPTPGIFNPMMLVRSAA